MKVVVAMLLGDNRIVVCIVLGAVGDATTELPSVHALWKVVGIEMLGAVGPVGLGKLVGVFQAFPNDVVIEF